MDKIMRNSTRSSLVGCIWTSLLLASRRKLVVSFLALGLSRFLGVQDAGAGTIRHDVPDQDYTNLAAQPQFASVGRLDITDAGNSYIASGTLIDPYWVLTAAHNVSFPDPTGVTFTLTPGGTPHTASEWIPHPLWNNNAPYNGYDVGLIRLSTPVTNVTPAIRYSGSGELGSIATIVGYGRT